MKKILTIVLLFVTGYANAQNTTGSKISADDMQKVLDQENAARKEVGVPPVIWSADLAKYAQEWADHLASSKSFEHRSQHQYGENIYMGSGNYTPLDASLAWYSEKGKYKYGKFNGKGGAGHYTQMIWKNTTQVGVGVAFDSDGKIYVVANYSPPGNWMGELPY